MLGHIKAVIFDMDGVIFDSEKVYYDACFVAAKKNNIDFSTEFVSQFAGKTSAKCQAILKEYLKDEVKAVQFWHDWQQARYAILDNNNMIFKDGFLSLLNFLNLTPCKKAIVTSALRRDLDENFKDRECILALFNPVITIEDVSRSKPDPEPYTKAMELLGYLPKDCIIIEDSISGTTAAVNSGANTIMINQGDILPKDINDKLIYRASSHSAILDFLKENKLGLA